MYKKPRIDKDKITDYELLEIIRAIGESREYLPNIAGEFLRNRDKMIILLGAYTGLRLGECLNLRWSDINFDKKEIQIDPGNNKERNGQVAVIGNKAEEILREYRKIFNQYIRSEFLFPSLITLEPITISTFNKKFVKILKEAGLHSVKWYTSAGQPISNYTFYDFRKYFGTKMYKVTRDPYIVMRALRQTKLSSVKPYILADKTDIKSAIDQVF